MALCDICFKNTLQLYEYGIGDGLAELCDDCIAEKEGRS